MELNAEDDGERKFILVQINELIKEKNIVDIALERIKKVSNKINNSISIFGHSKLLDTGVKVFKIDSNNIVDHKLNANEINQDLFSNLSSNFSTIKNDRNDLDLVFQSILDCRLTLDKKIKTELFQNEYTFYNIDSNFLICCFENRIDNIDFLKYLTSLKPSYIYFKESSFENDQIKINLEELFKNYSSDTVIKVF